MSNCYRWKPSRPFVSLVAGLAFLGADLFFGHGVATASTPTETPASTSVETAAPPEIRARISAPSKPVRSPLARLHRTAPRVLTEEDARLYRSIFAAQRAGHWAQADGLVAKLNDRLLMGHVLYQRYLSPTYPAKERELRAWLADYRDQPGANDIYTLARKRAGKHADTLPKPVAHRAAASGGDPDDSYPSPKSAAGKRWQSGLAAWKAHDYAKASEAFTSLAQARGLSGAMEAAAAFWASRADRAAGKSDRADRWLETAAEHPTTFYGLLAAAQLGRASALEWRAPTLSDASLGRLRRDPAVRRTIALVQINQPRFAEREMDAIYSSSAVGRRGTLLALACSLGLPRAQLRIATDLNSDTTTHVAARYPLPFWAPTGGFRVDPAFLFALMRQESRFDADAKSPAGALGLMQIMPNTARLVATRKSDQGEEALFNPIVSLTLGQRYIEALQSDLGAAHADPLTLSVAYNVGPNGMRKWGRKMGQGVDPLLFVETMPGEETRRHAKRVLTNFWLYSMRLQRGSSSLQAVAEGKWPGPLPNRFPERGMAIAANN